MYRIAHLKETGSGYITYFRKKTHMYPHWSQNASITFIFISISKFKAIGKGWNNMIVRPLVLQLVPDVNEMLSFLWLLCSSPAAPQIQLGIIAKTSEGPVKLGQQQPAMHHEIHTTRNAMIARFKNSIRTFRMCSFAMARSYESYSDKHRNLDRKQMKPLTCRHALFWHLGSHWQSRFHHPAVQQQGRPNHQMLRPRPSPGLPSHHRRTPRRLLSSHLHPRCQWPELSLVKRLSEDGLIQFLLKILHVYIYIYVNYIFNIHTFVYRYYIYIYGMSPPFL